jgi:hypothetical protein
MQENESNADDPAECAKIGHEYFEKKRFRKAYQYLKKIPKELLDTEEYKQAKKELTRIKGLWLFALTEL